MPKATVFSLLGLAVAALAAASCDDSGELLGPKPPAGALRFVDLDVGYLHACGLTAGGRAWCWGGNTTGALGDGTSDPSPRPVAVQTTRDFVDIDAGAAHNCALDDGGAAWCWGHNDEGQLGDGTQTPRPTPVAVEGDHEFVAISVGHAHACGLTADGAAWCWGDDTSGQLGNGTGDGQARSPLPVRVSIDVPLSQVSAGYYQTCGLDADGHAWCWGVNYVGQNGDSTFQSRHAPIAVNGDMSFDSLSTGDGVVCALDDADLYCWGSNRFHELARAPVDTVLAPEAVDVGDVAYVSVAVGAETMGGARPYVCAVRANDRAICWGGEMPNLREPGPEPTVLDGDIAFRTIASGPQFVCGLRRDGYAYCGGVGGSGQLGTGDDEDADSMVPVGAPD